MVTTALKKRARGRLSSLATVGLLRVNLVTRTATLNGKLLPLTLTEWQTIAFLAVQSPRVVSTGEIADFDTLCLKAGKRLGRPPMADRHSGLRRVATRIQQIREKLRDAGGQVEIRTARRKGYQLLVSEWAKPKKVAKAPNQGPRVVFINARCQVLVDPLIRSICRRLHGSLVGCFSSPAEVASALESGSFPPADLILTQLDFPGERMGIAAVYSVFSMVALIRERGITARIIGLDHPEKVGQSYFHPLKDQGVTLEPTIHLGRNVAQLALRIQQVLACQAQVA